MITVAQAAKLVKEHLSPAIPVTKQALFADRPYPPFHRVMMDGIAVNSESYQQGRRLFRVAGLCAAGKEAGILNDPLACMEVMTGAPLPRGADMVIPYEHLHIEDGQVAITKDITRSSWENIHLMGSDCPQGAEVLTAGAAINGPHMGIAASMGVDPQEVKKDMRIMIISTGDELVEIDRNPLNHQLRRSNIYALKTSLEINGLTDIELAHLDDDPLVIASHYQENAPKFDLMIYSGGVSKGKFDYLPSVWMELGVERIFHGISQRPGKPMWFGVDKKHKTKVFGLPGNPVSSLVCLHRYIIPGKEKFARLSKEVSFKHDLTFFIPVRLEFSADAVIWAHPMEIKNSGEFSALAGSDGFIELPQDQSIFYAGDAFPFYGWGML
jgi:molybdopterin molybdotransferase